MKMFKLAVAVMVFMTLAAGNLFAQSQGRFQWFTRASLVLMADWSDESLTFDGTPVERPGFGFYEDEDGTAYSWDSVGEILLWYGRDLISMWVGFSYRMGWGFSSEWVVMYDNAQTGNVGGRMRLRAQGSAAQSDGDRNFNPFSLNRVSMYGWFQAWDRRILMEMNPFGATIEEWGTVWGTPMALFHNVANGRRNNVIGNTGLWRENLAFFDNNEVSFFRLQVRNVVEGLNFGFALPNFGALEDLSWGYNSTMVDGVPVFWDVSDVFSRVVIGARYNAFDWGIAGGFQMDPVRGQRAYFGGEYRFMNHNLRVGADVKMLNIGAAFADGYQDQFDLDLAQRVMFISGPFTGSFTMYQKNLFWNDFNEFQLRFEAMARYVLVPSRLLARLCVNFDTGLGSENSRFWRVEIEPGLFWSIGALPISDNLNNYTGMFVRPNIQFGQRANPVDPVNRNRNVNRSDIDIFDLSVFIGFRWASSSN